MPLSPGYPIVLTADRTLMARYQLLFDGMLAASQTSTAPPALLGGLLMPRARSINGRAPFAPLGLRRIEAALLDGGFTADQVAVVDETGLAGAIGSETRVVGIASGEPIGHGMNSSTMTAVAGGRIYPEVMFRRLLARVREAVDRRAPSARVVLGGPGAWQLAADPGAMARLGIDHVVAGYAEGNAAEVFRGILEGTLPPGVVPGQGVPPEAIPRIRGASTMGVVEISRGCGLGCSFCTIARVPMIHLPEETVAADVATNVAAGNTSVAVLSEDLFRYGATGPNADPGALLSLLRRLRRVPGLRLIQCDHANVISIARYSDAELAEVYSLLAGDTGSRYVWVNVGIEAVSEKLLRANGGGAKMGRSTDPEWSELCAEQVRRLCRAGFFPMLSLLIGLPGETEEDVRRATAWVEMLSGERVSVFPMLYAPIDGSAGLRTRDLTRAHWDLIRASYRLNFRWLPKMYWDNQAAVGVPVPRRLLLQALGRGQVVQWSTLFAWHAWRAAA